MSGLCLATARIDALRPELRHCGNSGSLQARCMLHPGLGYLSCCKHSCCRMPSLIATTVPRRQPRSASGMSQLGWLVPVSETSCSRCTRHAKAYCDASPSKLAGGLLPEGTGAGRVHDAHRRDDVTWLQLKERTVSRSRSRRPHEERLRLVGDDRCQQDLGRPRVVPCPALL